MRISDWSSDVCSSDLFLFSGPGNVVQRHVGHDHRLREDGGQARHLHRQQQYRQSMQRYGSRQIHGNAGEAGGMMKRLLSDRYGNSTVELAIIMPEIGRAHV